MPGKLFFAIVFSFALLSVFLAGCAQPAQTMPSVTPSFSPSVLSSVSTSVSRLEKIPVNAAKMTPALDAHPPILHSSEFEAPAPLPAPVNSAGAEDSPFITLDGETLYFFFTPDASVPVEKQLLDGVTGVWVSTKNADGVWSEPERVVLQDAGKLSLDGCEFVSADESEIWFCSAREGFTGIHWFKAENAGSPEKWRDWVFAGEWFGANEVGELHFSADGGELYFHSSRAGGGGQLDVWVSKKVNGEWQPPENVVAVNTAENEGWPFLNRAGDELWFLRTVNGTPAILRSKKNAVDDGWTEPELVVSQFAGEPTLDDAGNLYFVHHYYRDGKMIEADLYVARKKTA